MQLQNHIGWREFLGKNLEKIAEIRTLKCLKI